MRSLIASHVAEVADVAAAAHLNDRHRDDLHRLEMRRDPRVDVGLAEPHAAVLPGQLQARDLLAIDERVDTRRGDAELIRNVGGLQRVANRWLHATASRDGKRSSIEQPKNCANLRALSIEMFWN